MKDYLEQYLKQKGYQRVATNVPEFSLCFRINANTVEVISLIEDREGLYLSPELYDRIKEQATHLFEEKGYDNVHVMTLILTDDFDKIREVCSKDQFCWIIDRMNRRIVTYENQVDDFYGLRNCLNEFFYMSPNEWNDRLKMNFEEERYQKRKGLKDYISVTSLIVFVNLVIYIICTFTGDLLYNIGVLEWDRVIDKHEYFRLITSVFLHADIDHIFGNMLVLFFAGRLIEKILGPVRYTILYLVSGIGGSLLSFWFQSQTGDFYNSLGASGAVFGVLGALLVFVLMRHQEVRDITVPRLLFYLLYSIYLGFRSTNIDNYAHIGGVLVGIILAVLLWGTVKNKKGNK